MDDEEDLWLEVTRGIKPLPGKKPPVKQHPAKTDPAESNSLAPKPHPAAKRATPRAQEIDARTAQKLKRGQMKIEARLDLHGMRLEEARKALEKFLLQSHSRGARCVLVVTGKGLLDLGRHEDSARQRPGVIKRSLSSWLREPPLRDIVLKTEEAQIKDGGAGAAYILLRRNR